MPSRMIRVQGYAQRSTADPAPTRHDTPALRMTPGAPGSKAGEPVEQSEVLGPFGQVVDDYVGVGGFEGSAFRLGRGACVDLGGGQVDVPEDVSDVGQRDACLI